MTEVEISDKVATAESVDLREQSTLLRSGTVGDPNNYSPVSSLSDYQSSGDEPFPPVEVGNWVVSVDTADEKDCMSASFDDVPPTVPNSPIPSPHSSDGKDRFRKPSVSARSRKSSSSSTNSSTSSSSRSSTSSSSSGSNSSSDGSSSSSRSSNRQSPRRLT